VTKTYNARLATRITSGVDARLRQLALVSRRRISHVLDDVLDAALPTPEDLAARLSRFADPAQDQESQSPAGQADADQPTSSPAAADPAPGRHL
jgi:hypothetical protein